MLASATDAGRAFDLRCEIREKLLAWIRDQHPEALPVTRVAPKAESDAVLCWPELTGARP